MPLTTEQFKQQVEEETKNMIGYKCWSDKDFKAFAHHIISLTADMMVGEGAKKTNWKLVPSELKNYAEAVGYSVRIEEERALAEELKKL